MTPHSTTRAFGASRPNTAFRIGPPNYVNLLSKTATMQGFNALDEWGRFEEAFAALSGWEQDGLLAHRETVFDGLESCIDALNGLFTGANIGKMLVKVSEPTPT